MTRFEQRVAQSDEAIPSRVAQRARRIALLSALPSLLVVALLCGGSAPLRAAEPVAVDVRGIEGELKKNVQAALAVPPGLVRDGRVDRHWLDRFVSRAPERASRAIEPFGYYGAVIATKVETAEDGTYRVIVTVVPGEPVRVTALRVTLRGDGAGEKALRRLVDRFPLRRGGILRQDEYERAKGALIARARDLGYLDAAYPVHEILLNRSERSAEIDLTFDTGPRYAFGDAALPDNTGYPAPFLRRYLAFKPGDPFSYAKLGQTQINFHNADRFKEVVISPRKEEARDHDVPVDIRLVPSAPKRLRPGVGYGTDTGPRISLRYQDVNAFRRGQEFDAALSLSNIRQALGAKYIFPDLHNAASFTSVEGGLTLEHVSDHFSRLAFGEADRLRDFGRGAVGTLYLRAQFEDYTIAGRKSSSFLLYPGARYLKRSYRGPEARPEEGYRYQLEARGTDRALGSDTGFLQFIGSGDGLLALPARFSLLSRLSAGYTLPDGPTDKIPVSLRFFAGGDQSVRGYAYQSLGPVDNTGKVVGGRQLLTGSVEIDRAILANWGVAAFYDAGNAFNSFSRIRLFQGAGLGIRYYTVVGPIRLDVARQLRVADPSFRIHVSMGFSF